jgi:hypothetical protein
MPETPTTARRSPDGYVAQRMPIDINGHGHWLLTGLNEHGQVDLQVLADDEVADWPPLVDNPCACNTTEQRTHTRGDQAFCVAS